MQLGVIGGLNLDILGMPHAALSLWDSNPGTITLQAGGVGHNIGVSLAKAGHQVRMLTALGRDAQAGLLNQLCRDDGIDLQYAIRTNAPTCTYLCLHDETGDMYAAINDMQAIDQLTPDAVKPLLPTLQDCALCVMDTNPPEDTLRLCAETLTMPIFVDPVSAFKGSKVLSFLHRITAIKPNLTEARALTGAHDPENAARALLEGGAKQVYISMGGDGLFYADQSGMGHVPALPLPQGTLLTGAGDSLSAGLIEGMLRGLDPLETARLGCKSAYLALTKSNQPL